MSNWISACAMTFVSAFLANMPIAGSAANLGVMPKNPIEADCPMTLQWRKSDPAYSSETLCRWSPENDPDGDWMRDFSNKGLPRGDDWDGTYTPTTNGLYHGLFSAGNGGNQYDWHDEAATATLKYGSVIRLTGQIAPGDAARLEELLISDSLLTCVKETYCPYSAVLSLNSPGGNLAEALRLAEVVRKYQLVTVLEKNAVCASSCVYPFVSGYTDYAGFFFPRRFSHFTARIGVHQPALIIPEGTYTQADMENAMKLANKVQSNALRAFVAAQVNILVLKEMYDTPSDAMSFLSPARMSQIARIYGRDFELREDLSRLSVLNYCSGEYELLTGQAPPPSLLDNLEMRGTSFVVTANTGEFACYGTRADSGRWMIDACIGQECQIYRCVADPGLEFEGEPMFTFEPEFTPPCPTAEEAPGFHLDIFYSGLGIAMNSLLTGQSLRFARNMLLARYAAVTEYGSDDTSLFLSTFDTIESVPPEYCGRIDFKDPQIALELQTRLNAAGFDAGTPDGLLGRKSFAAIQMANEQLLGQTDTRPTGALLARLGYSDPQINAMRLCAK